jgi:hypothetical protein
MPAQPGNDCGISLDRAGEPKKPIHDNYEAPKPRCRLIVIVSSVITDPV